MFASGPLSLNEFSPSLPCQAYAWSLWRGIMKDIFKCFKLSGAYFDAFLFLKEGYYEYYEVIPTNPFVILSCPPRELLN